MDGILTDRPETALPAAISAEQSAAVGEKNLREWLRILQKYKSGKANLERRVVAAENWWKLRNEVEEQKVSRQNREDFACKSGWLHNVIVSKHADAMEAYPEPNILPREAGDVEEAKTLSAIVPCILEQNHFERTYSDNLWQKLKTGTGCYMITWEKSKLNGLGDISIERVNQLNLFWEPGISHIQDSKHVFFTYLEDKEELESQYPAIRGKLKGDTFQATRFLYDDHIPTEGMCTVINHYYHRYEGGRKVLHYCKFVGDEILYSTENEGLTEGLYEHGKYPFVLDPLFPVEGSPCGYGFIDLAWNAQTQIDLMKTAFLKNTMAGATPRYFIRQDGSVNEEEFLDLTTPLVHVTGMLDDSSLRPISYNALSGNYINVLENTITELREVTGNTETSTGSSGSGATAASAIAALQEASGKGSRDSSKASYRGFSEIVDMVIELIRQFYDLPRRFRITGELGQNSFISYTNAGLKPQNQGQIGQVDMGYRLPVFDIKIEPQKRNAYTKLSQNELALQFYSAGFFQPQNAETAMMTLSMMEFEGKDKLMQQISANASMYQQLEQYRALAIALAQQYRPELAAGLMQQAAGQPPAAGNAAAVSLPEEAQEASHVRKAREQSAQASQPR